MKNKILIAAICAIVWPAFAFATGQSFADLFGVLTVGAALATLPALIIIPEARQSVDELVDLRSKLLEQENDILDAPAETRGEGDAFEKVLSKEQRERLEQIEKDVRALDKRIESEQRRERRQAEQAELERRSKTPANPRLIPDVRTGLSDREHRDLDKFNLAVLVRHLAEGRSIESLPGIEGEMAQEGRSEAIASGIEVRSRSIMVSGKALQSAETRDLTVTGGTGGNKGGMVVPTEKMGLLDSLMFGNVFATLGATVLPNVVGNFDVPRIVDGTAPAHKTEVAQADEYDPTLAQVQFKPKRLPTVLEVSNQLLMQGNESALLAFLQNHLRRKLVSLMQVAFVNGGGTTDAEGILQTSGIGAVVGGTNGAAPAWTHIVGLETQLGIDDALLGELSYLLNAKTVGLLKETPKVASTDSRMILEDREGATLNGRPYATSNAVPSNLTKGTADGTCSAMIFGNFADYYIANWSGIEFLVNPYSKDDYGLTRINAAVYYDGHAVRPQSFSAMQDAITG